MRVWAEDGVVVLGTLGIRPTIAISERRYSIVSQYLDGSVRRVNVPGGALFDVEMSARWTEDADYELLRTIALRPAGVVINPHDSTVAVGALVSNGTPGRWGAFAPTRRLHLTAAGKAFAPRSLVPMNAGRGWAASWTMIGREHQ